MQCCFESTIQNSVNRLYGRSSSKIQFKNQIRILRNSCITYIYQYIETQPDFQATKIEGMGAAVRTKTVTKLCNLFSMKSMMGRNILHIGNVKLNVILFDDFIFLQVSLHLLKTSEEFEPFPFESYFGPNTLYILAWN